MQTKRQADRGAIIPCMLSNDMYCLLHGTKLGLKMHDVNGQYFNSLLFLCVLRYFCKKLNLRTTLTNFQT